MMIIINNTNSATGITCGTVAVFFSVSLNSTTSIVKVEPPIVVLTSEPVPFP